MFTLTPGLIVAVVAVLISSVGLIRRDIRFSAIGTFVAFASIVGAYTDRWWITPL